MLSQEAAGRKGKGLIMSDTLTGDEIVKFVNKALCERVIESEELAEHIAATLAGDIWRSNEFECPSCGAQLQFSMNLTIRKCFSLEKGETWKKEPAPLTPQKQTFTDAEEVILS